MTGFLIKLIACPSVILAADYVFPNIDYVSFYQAMIVGLVLAIVTHLLEVLILKRGTLWISTVMDFAVAMLLVYYSQYLFTGAFITWAGAVLTALLVAMREILLHLYLIGTGKTKKSPT